MTTPSDSDDVKPGLPSAGVSAGGVRRGPTGRRPPINMGRIPVGGQRTENDIPLPPRHAFVGFVSEWDDTDTTGPIIVTLMRQDGLTIEANLFDRRADLEKGMVLCAIQTRKPGEEALIEGQQNPISYIIPDALTQRVSWGLAYVTETVTTADDTFTADLFASYPKPLARDDERLAIVVNNPETAEASGEYQHAFAIGDLVIVIQWLNDEWLVLGGVSSAVTNYSMMFVGTLNSAITGATATVNVTVTATDHPDVDISDVVSVSNYCKETADSGARVVCMANEGLTMKYIINLECP